ncbi:MAG: histidine utilization repressor [Sneathiella sp.]
MKTEDLNIQLDKDQSVPLYKKIKKLISGNIEAGLWKPGDKIPTEHHLVKELKASRMTVNRALRELMQENVLVRKQGSGTFVSPSKLETGLLEIRNIAEDITERGNVHSIKILKLEKIKPEEDFRSLMHGAVGDEFYHSVCLHEENSAPIQLEDRYVNPILVPYFIEQDFDQQTPGGYLLDNVSYSHADHRISALMPTQDQARWLELSAQEPVLMLERLTYCAEGVITAVRLYHPANRYEFSGTFIPHRGAGKTGFK